MDPIPYHPWDWYIYLHLADFYGSNCRWILWSFDTVDGSEILHQLICPSGINRHKYSQLMSKGCPSSLLQDGMGWLHETILSRRWGRFCSGWIIVHIFYCVLYIPLEVGSWNSHDLQGFYISHPNGGCLKNFWSIHQVCLSRTPKVILTMGPMAWHLPRFPPTLGDLGGWIRTKKSNDGVVTGTGNPNKPNGVGGWT